MSSKDQVPGCFDVVCDLAVAITGSEAARVHLASQPLPASEVLVIDGTSRDSRFDSLVMPDGGWRPPEWCKSPGTPTPA